MARSKKFNKTGSTSSNGLFWALILVGIFVLIGNWEKTSAWFEPKKETLPAQKPPRATTPAKPTSTKAEKSTNTPASVKTSVSFDFEKAPDFIYPTGQQSEIVRHSVYALGYAEKYEQPAWVAYRLTAVMVSGSNKRQDNFRPDPNVTTGSAVPEDYRNSGYDRGHLAPVADFKASAKWMDETFFMSNMSPQLHEFNAGIWEKLESATRGWARHNKAIYVVCGPILRSGLPTIGRYNKVAVPDYYYKVIYDLQQPELKAIGFILRNEGSRKPLQSFAITVDEVEKRTGLDFFPSLPDELENTLESQRDPDTWFEKRKKK